VLQVEGETVQRCRTGSPSILGSLFAAAIVLSSTTAAVGAQDAAKIEHGQKVYAAQKCRVCHSIAGQGQKKGPLDGVGSKYKEDELREWIVNAAEMQKKAKTTRKPLMKNYDKLPKEDVDALVAYMMSLKK
jgi:mono/diheme cytochrome c family protein